MDSWGYSQRAPDGGVEVVLIIELAYVAVDCAFGKLDLGVSLEIAHLSLAIRVKRREQPQTATAGGELPDSIPCC